MEKVATTEVSRLLLVLGLGLVGLLALLNRMVARIRGSFKPFQKATILYMVVSFTAFCLVPLMIKILSFTGVLQSFIFAQIFFLCLGIAHFRLMHHYLRWSGDEKSFWQELLFTVILTLAGSIVFSITHRFFFNDGMAYTMGTSGILFLIPFLVHHSFVKAISIPPKIIRQWFYPVHEAIAEPDESKLKNLLIISFEFKKTGRR